jgi:predicted ATPase
VHCYRKVPLSSRRSDQEVNNAIIGRRLTRSPKGFVFDVIKDRFFVLTGGFGSGKSTLLEHLKSCGLRGVAEPARPILAQQRSIQGNGVPEKDPRLFVELMFSRMLDAYQQSDALTGPILFDRGIPDILGYAALLGFAFPPGENAARLCRYNPRVFIAPAWDQIYCTDDERTVPFSHAREFGTSVRAIYQRFGYTLIDLPCVAVEERGDFILNHLGLGGMANRPSSSDEP